MAGRKPYIPTPTVLDTPDTLIPNSTDLGLAYPGGPSLGEYGVDLNSLEETLSWSASPVPEPKPQGLLPLPSTYTLGGTGTPIFAGFLQDPGEYNPIMMGREAIRTYEKMRRSDADIRALLIACKLPIRAAEKQIIPGTGPNSPNHQFAKEIADFVRENLFGGLETTASTGVVHSQTWESVEENALLMLDFGCAGHEEIWNVDGDSIKLRRLAPRLAPTFYRWWCLSVDTPVPTPTGWKLLKDFKVGDEVFDEHGEIQKVLERTERWVSDECYRVTFSDGSSIVANANHRWLTQTTDEREVRKAGKLRTTKEIFTTHRRGRKSKHSISLTEPVKYPYRELAVDPYLLGVWLGDGTHSCGVIAASTEDVEEERSLLSGRGYKVGILDKGEKNVRCAKLQVYGLVTALKKLGLYKNKHIPQEYLLASVDQRRALLAGLLDADGCVTKQGRIEFVNTNRQLIDGVAELARSLGELTYINGPRKGRNNVGSLCKDWWIVGFTPSQCPFRLARKIAQVKQHAPNVIRAKQRHYIVSVVPTEAQEVTCLRVSGKSKLFLAGTSFVATHNTDPDGEVLNGIEQYGYRKNAYINVFIPAEKFCVFTQQQEGSNFFGISVLRAAYKSWYMKALALDTPIPAPDGWTTMGTVEVGQEVFGSDGKPCRVLGKSEVFLDKACYKMTFSNGSTVVAGEDHNWFTITRAEGRKNLPGRVRTTKEISESLFTSGGKGRVDYNHRVERCGAAQYTEKMLPIDPYLMGLWLGGGSHSSGYICCDERDSADALNILQKAAVNLVVKAKPYTSGAFGGARIVSVQGLRRVLKQAGVFRNKHIPDIYLTGSVEQRKALVAGLLDSGGTVGRHGVCQFCNTNKSVIDSFVELLRSLGESPRLYGYDHLMFGRKSKKVWQVHFSPVESPFRLPRKTAAFLATLSPRGRRHAYIKITGCELVPSVPIQCISVDAPDHQFLVSHCYTRTCNSQLYSIDAISLERNAMGIPTFKAPAGSTVEDRQLAQSWGQSMAANERTSLVLPTGWDFDVTGIKGRIRDPWKSITHHSEQIVKSVLGMFLNLGTTATGSRALGNTMLDFFFLGLEATARHMSSAINQQTIRRLVDYNFNPRGKEGIPYPQLAYSNIVVLNPIEIANAIRDLGNSQTDIIQPDDELEDNLRRRLSLPLKTSPRIRFLPVNIRDMVSPEPGETIQQIESGKVGTEPAGQKAGGSSLVAQGTQLASKVRTAKLPGAVPGVEPMPKSQAQKVQASEIAIGVGSAVYKLLLSEGLGKTVCVDFDGVLATHTDKKSIAGSLIPQGKQLVLDLHKKGYRIVILTARTNHGPVHRFLKDNNIPYDGVTCVKPPAVAYLDNKAVYVSGKKPDSYAKALKKVSKFTRKDQ